jgi:hypothetical protein
MILILRHCVYNTILVWYRGGLRGGAGCSSLGGTGVAVAGSKVDRGSRESKKGVLRFTPCTNCNTMLVCDCISSTSLF